ncbi:Predicted arabinose efflux permease, MFS family [Planifilum fulgidum]|jgi:MFS family permease|uniref:Predicted arabinose efflux permease, MFS family n=1 Tax=Planifilum fulgidum TaxID=201973 RepID=A0A1I2KXJ9_9BACL|nr:MFS transporter [Planifilum fulgidum]MBO2497184.1 MFS transporter [Bacillota bacterium]MBO2531569.1 MFS transporter [Thermoactinomycetaceae bacterium]SFF69897.1 Predicted arabinose efflux permease, MFS family [Planifilum fulgidum]
MKELIRNRRFLLVWLAQAASGLGGIFAMFIEAWLVYSITGSKMAMSGLVMAFMIASLTVQLGAGPFLDRWDRRLVMALSQWSRAVGYLVPTALYVLDSLSLWHLYLAVVIGGMAEPLFRSSSMAYLPDLLPEKQLVKGNAVLEGTMNGMALVGPPLAGVALGWLGPEMILSALVFLLALSGTLLILLPGSRPDAKGEKQSWIAQFKEGLGIFRVHPMLLGTALLIMTSNFAYGAIEPLFLPYVSELLHGTPVQFGLLTSAFSLGMLLGSVWMSFREEPRNRRMYMILSNGVAGVAIAVMGAVHLFPVALLMGFVSGICAIVFNVLNTTLYQRFVPKEIRGRVFTVRILLAQSAIPLGAFLGGGFAELWGLAPLFLIAGGVVILVTVVAWFHPVFHRLNQQVSAPQKEEISLSG